MVDILSSTGQDPLRGTQLDQEKEEGKQLQLAPLSPEPDFDKPIRITEDINYPEDEDLDILNFEDDDSDLVAFDGTNPEILDFSTDDENLSVLDSLDEDDDLDFILDDESDYEDEAIAEAANIEAEEDSPVYQHETYEAYLQDEKRRNNNIQIGRTSFVKTAWEWTRQALDEDYVPEDSIAGREASIEVLKSQLNELGDVDLTNSRAVRQADFIWDNIHRLTELNAMDKAAIESELPTMGEFVDVVTENPGLVFDQMVIEMANKPELFLVAPFSAARGAMAAEKAVTAVNAGVKTVRVAKNVGGALGAGTGAFTLGTIDRMMEQSLATGEIDTLRAMKQSQIDFKLGLIMYGGGKVLSSSVAKASDVRRKAKVNRAKANALAETTETNLDTKLKSEVIEEALNDKATETYIDMNGSVYNFEVRDVETFADRLAEIDKLKELRASVENKQARKVINKQIKTEQDAITVERLEGSAPVRVADDTKSLKTKEGIESSNAAELWLSSKDPKPLITKNYVKFEDPDGNPVTLRRLTPQILRSKGVRVQGINSLDLEAPTDVLKAQSNFKHVFKDMAVSATAGLERLAKSSQAARLLLDTVNPHSGTRGRAPIETIQELTHYKQGQYATEVDRLTKGLSAKDSKILTEHMREVNISNDPRIINAAEGLRNLIAGAAAYAKANGMNIDYDEKWLPRYYNQKSLKTEDSRNALAQAVSETVDADGKLLYKYDEARGSADNIYHNRRKITDEAVLVERGGKINPIGARSWEATPDSALHPFLGDDVAGDINKYLMNLVKRTEHDKVFGYNGRNIDTWIKQINKDLGKDRILSDPEVDGIRDLYELVSGKYGGKPIGKGATDAALAATNLIKLPFVTLTSALEPTSMLFRLGTTTAIRGILEAYGLKFARKVTGSKKLARMKREAEEGGITHSAAIKERLDAMVGDGLQGLPATVNNKVMKGFLLHQWTEHTRLVAYEAANTEIMKSIKRIAKDPDAKEHRRWLAEQGISPSKALKWLDAGADIEDSFYTSIHKGGLRLTNTMIANPNKLNKPKWMSSRASIPRLGGAFKSFGAVFNNDVSKSTIDDVVKLWNGGNQIQALKKAGMLLGTVSAMSYWTAYKFDAIGGNGVGDDEPEDVAAKMLQGVTGLVVPGASFLAPLAASRNLTSQIAGPTAGMVESGLRGDFDKISPIPKAIDRMQGK